MTNLENRFLFLETEFRSYKGKKCTNTLIFISFSVRCGTFQNSTIFSHDDKKGASISCVKVKCELIGKESILYD